MDASVIVLDSSDDESTPRENQNKRKADEVCENNNTEKPRKRIKPTRIDDHEIKIVGNSAFTISDDWEKEVQNILKNTIPDDDEAHVEEENRKTDTPESSSGCGSSTNKEKDKEMLNVIKNPITTEFSDLLEACRKADPSSDMEKLIEKKLVKYYEVVHPDYVNSKSFKKCVRLVTEEVSKHPELVYLKLSNIIQEMNIRRKSRPIVMNNADVVSTGNEKKDAQIRKLNKALYILNKRIAKLEEAEVDFDADVNSTYMLVERYKKRAFEIYSKICDITGESKHAHRSVRKPIRYQGTLYPEFNKTIEKYINRHNQFPDYCDVYKCLDHCNRLYGYQMKKDELTKVSEDAFTNIGKALQNRRKADLYETVQYFTGCQKDPALNDKELFQKLECNKKQYNHRITEVIDKFVRIQECDVEEDEQENDDEDLIEKKPNISEHVDDFNTAGDKNNEKEPLAEDKTKTSSSESSENDAIKENAKPIDVEISDEDVATEIS